VGVYLLIFTIKGLEWGGGFEGGQGSEKILPPYIEIEETNKEKS